MKPGQQIEIKINSIDDIFNDIVKHSVENPDHGVGCACLDKLAAQLRTRIEKSLKENKGDDKALSNILVVISYIQRNPIYDYSILHN